VREGEVVERMTIVGKARKLERGEKRKERKREES
jgi:hypothetical protein